MHKSPQNYACRLNSILSKRLIHVDSTIPADRSAISRYICIEKQGKPKTAALQPSRDRVLESAIFYPFSSTRIIVFKFDQEFSIETFDQSRKNLIIKGKYTLKPKKILDISFIFEYLLYLFFSFYISFMLLFYSLYKITRHIRRFRKIIKKVGVERRFPKRFIVEEKVRSDRNRRDVARRVENLRVRRMRHFATTCGVAFREAFESCGLPTVGNAYYRISTGVDRKSRRVGPRDRRTEAERETVRPARCRYVKWSC